MNRKQKDGAFVAMPFGVGHVWMVRHKYGERLWSLPGGGVEESQNFVSAAIAECREETGLKLELEEKLGSFTGRISKTSVELWLGNPMDGFDSFSGLYDGNEILCQGVIPWDLPLDFPIYRAQRMFLQVLKHYYTGEIKVPIEDYLSAPFENEVLQEWFEGLKQKRRE